MPQLRAARNDRLGGARQSLESILKKYRNTSGKHWDCIIPVSGGKDSTTQTVRLLQLGMNPLCVTATT